MASFIYFNDYHSILVIHSIILSYAFNNIICWKCFCNIFMRMRQICSNQQVSEQFIIINWDSYNVAYLENENFVENKNCWIKAGNCFTTTSAVAKAANLCLDSLTSFLLTSPEPFFVRYVKVALGGEKLWFFVFKLNYQIASWESEELTAIHTVQYEKK